MAMLNYQAGYSIHRWATAVLPPPGGARGESRRSQGRAQRPEDHPRLQRDRDLNEQLLVN